MAKAERHHVARGQASIVPPLSNRLLCRHLSRGQLPPDTCRLVKRNTLVRLPSCVLRSLDTLHECFGIGFTYWRRPTWVDRPGQLAEFWLRPRPVVLDKPAKIIGY